MPSDPRAESDDVPADFDAAEYLGLHPDVAAAQVDAAEHYVQHGRREGRAYRRPDARTRTAFLQRQHELEHFVWLLNRVPAFSPPALQRSPASKPNHDDLPLVRRVMAAYRAAVAAFVPSSGFWDAWHEGLKQPIHAALSGDDVGRAASVLRDPASSPFFWGFDAIASAPRAEPEPHELVLSRLCARGDWQRLYALWLCDTLRSLAEAVGARRAAYPEVDVDTLTRDGDRRFDVDTLLDDIERELGTELDFPNPFPEELGLPSRRGILGFRAIQAAYQGWRIAQLANGDPGFRVLEIGAGLGRTAYYARRFGVREYTILDVPITSAAQGYFLGRVLGADQLSLGAEGGGASLRILPSTDLSALEPRFDLIVNVDSLTEMPRAVAQDYWSFARRASPHLLSINHEFNPHTVRELYRAAGLRASRHPYPLRRGYVEELISF